MLYIFDNNSPDTKCLYYSYNTANRDKEIEPTVSTHLIVFTIHLCNGLFPVLISATPSESSTVIPDELSVITVDSKESTKLEAIQCLTHKLNYIPQVRGF